MFLSVLRKVWIFVLKIWYRYRENILLYSNFIFWIWEISSLDPRLDMRKNQARKLNLNQNLTFGPKCTLSIVFHSLCLILSTLSVYSFQSNKSQMPSRFNGR
uniref:Uncharacterized protein n=1 Tax=Cacopsylla melanoneura TaxID=428564 RepID=A0A8D8ZHG3_9HEMI